MEVQMMDGSSGGAEEEKKGKRRHLPYNYVSFLKDAAADKQALFDTPEAIWDQLYKGVLLNKGTHMYWIDEESNNNCLIIFSKGLGIVHGDNERYWRWNTEEIRDGVEVKVAELIDVCWLQVSGSFRTIMFSPGTLYEVVLVAKMRQGSSGWRTSPVNLNLTLPDGHTAHQSQILLTNHVTTDVWTDVLLGQFTLTPTTVGKITFSLSEFGGHWKSGLLIKGVKIHPKSLNKLIMVG